MTRGRASEEVRMETHFVYRCFDHEGGLLYVGCTRDPRRRARQHTRTSKWVGLVASVTLKAYDDWYAARRAEDEAIYVESPRFNRIGGGRMKQADRDEARRVKRIARRIAPMSLSLLQADSIAQERKRDELDGQIAAMRELLEFMREHPEYVTAGEALAAIHLSEEA